MTTFELLMTLDGNCFTTRALMAALVPAAAEQISPSDPYHPGRVLRGLLDDAIINGYIKKEYRDHEEHYRLTAEGHARLAQMFAEQENEFVNFANVDD